MIKYLLGIKRYPSNIIFFVTSRCNSECRTCFYHYKNTKEEDELKLDEIVEISRKSKFVPFLSISGGEPFLREDLPEICIAFYENSSTTVFDIPTNCQNTELIVRSLARIAAGCPDSILQLDMSLDGLGELHDEIRGRRGSFARFNECYHELVKLKQKYRNIRLKINITYSKFNQKNVKSIVDYVEENYDINSISLSFIQDTPRDAAAKEVGYSDYTDNLNFIYSFNEKNSTDYYSGILALIHKKALSLKNREIERGEISIRCKAVKDIVVIDETGNVFPCEPYFDRPMGNLRENKYDIKKIIDSPEASQLRKSIEEKKCLCSWPCAAVNNILSNPAYMVRPVIFGTIDYIKKSLQNSNYKC